MFYLCFRNNKQILFIMTNLEMALSSLESKGINAKIENDTLYVIIYDCELELSDFEINFQVSEYKNNEQAD